VQGGYTFTLKQDFQLTPQFVYSVQRSIPTLQFGVNANQGKLSYGLWGIKYTSGGVKAQVYLQIWDILSAVLVLYTVMILESQKAAAPFHLLPKYL